MASKKASTKKKSTKKLHATKSAPVKKVEKKSNTGTICRWAIGCFAVFLIITFFEGIDSGILGGIREVLKGLFGFGYYLFPFFLLFAVITWGKEHTANTAAAKALLFTADFLFLLSIVHLISVNSSLNEGAEYSEAVKSFTKLYDRGIVLESGGAIGGAIGAGLANCIGWLATAILSSIAVFVCTVLLCGSTPSATFKAIVNFFRNLSFDTGKEPDEDEDEPEIITRAQLEKDRKEREKEKVEKTQEEHKQKDKHKMPAVLLDDAEIGNENKDSRFIAPEDEEEEFFQNIGQPEELKFTDSIEIPPKDNPAAVNTEAATETPAAEQTAPAAETAEAPETNDKADEELTVVEDDEAAAANTETAAPVVEEPAPYVFPPIDLLTADNGDKPKPMQSDVVATSRKLEEVLESFKVKAKVVGASFGPAVTRYEVQPETGVRVRQIANLADDIALHLAATAIRIENIPGKSAIGIEIPNRVSSIVRLRSLIENSTFQNHKSKLFCCLGEDVSGQPVYLDIAKMPHLLIAGATGQGKSVCINSMIISLLYHARPDEVKMLMIDPKKVEMQSYNGIPHLLVPVISDAKKAAGTLNWACVEMENRYNLIQEVGAKNLQDYNAIIKDDPERKPEPYIVIFIDELADLMLTAPDDVETSICRLAQKARAAGIHLVIGTQRPSVDVITGLIKANIPSRIACTVVSQIDSRTILDMAGAEKLLGKGDMLFSPVGSMKPLRVQGAFVDDKSELVAITEFVKQAAVTTYDEKIIAEIEREAKLCGAPKHGHAAESEGSEEAKMDDKFFDALELAIDAQNISTSMIQTRLGLGYARAARIVGNMETKGYIGPFDSATKKRRIIITKEELMELKLGKADHPDEE